MDEEKKKWSGSWLQQIWRYPQRLLAIPTTQKKYIKLHQILQALLALMLALLLSIQWETIGR